MQNMAKKSERTNFKLTSQCVGMCTCVNVRERKKRERERVNVCLCLCVFVCVCVCHPFQLNPFRIGLNTKLKEMLVELS